MLPLAILHFTASLCVFTVTEHGGERRAIRKSELSKEPSFCGNDSKWGM
jgi:hypothetical protein